MDKSNIVKLAKLMGKFTELGSSFVITEDIKAIQKSSDGEGMEIITPHGTFHDDMDFDSFRTRIGDILEAMKMDDLPEPQKLPEPLKGSGRKGGRIVLLDSQESPPKYPHPEIPEGMTASPPPGVSESIPREVVLNLGENGFTGNLFSDPNLNLVNRNQIVVSSMSGERLAEVSVGGQVTGKNISGVVYESGKCRLAAKNYEGGNQIKVNFLVARKGEL